MELIIILEKEQLNILKKKKKSLKSKFAILTFSDLKKYCATFTNQVYEIIPLPFEIEKEICKSFTEEFYNSFSPYIDFSEYIEIHINNIFCYIVIPLFSILYSIQYLLDKLPISKIILIGGNKKILYFVLYGFKSKETQFNYLFRNSWFYNYFIYKLFAHKYNVIFLSETNSYILKAIKTFREITVLIFFSLFPLFKHIYKTFKISFLNKKNKKLPISDNIILFIVRAIPQARAIRGLINTLRKCHFCPIILSYELLFSSYDLWSYLKKYYSNELIYSLYEFKSIIFFIYIITKNFLKWIRYKFNFSLKSKSKLFYFGYNSTTISIPLNEILKEVYLFPNFQVYEKMLNSFLKKIKKEYNNIVVFSLEMVGKYAFLERKAIKDLSLKCYNIQTALFSIKNYPVIVVSDFFFVNSYDNFLKLKNLGFRNKGEIKFIGPLKYLDFLDYKYNPKKSLSTILFITQPYGIDINIQILKAIIKWRDSNLKIKIIIKLHPRDFKSNYDFCCKEENVFFVKEEIELYDLILDADLLIGKTSSVIQESLFLGTPFLSCLFTLEDRTIQADYIPCDSYLVCFNEEQLISRLNNYQSVINEFINFRQNYFKKQRIPSANVIVQNLLEIINKGN